MGLSIARNLTRLHGARLDCSSDGPGKGFTFSLVLPPAEAASGEADTVQPMAPSGAADESPFLRLPRVLVVDDSVDSAQSMADLLRSQGCQVALAHDGVQALDRIAKASVERVLLDVRLPLLDG